MRLRAFVCVCVCVRVCVCTCVCALVKSKTIDILDEKYVRNSDITNLSNLKTAESTILTNKYIR